MAQAQIIRDFFDKIYDDLHTFVQTRLKAKMNILEALYIRQCCDMLEGLLTVPEEEHDYVFSNLHLERLFLFSCMWSLGAVLELEDRVKLEEFVRAHPSKMSMWLIFFTPFLLFIL